MAKLNDKFRPTVINASKRLAKELISGGMYVFSARLAVSANWEHKVASLLLPTNKYTVGVFSQLFKISFVLPIRLRPVKTVI
jgi:hypothetical protein